MDLDRYTLQILAELQRDARQTVQQLSTAVGLSPTPCWKRVKELEAAGVITGYTALVDRERLGLNLSVVVEKSRSLTVDSPPSSEANRGRRYDRMTSPSGVRAWMVKRSSGRPRSRRRIRPLGTSRTVIPPTTCTRKTLPFVTHRP